MVSEVVLEQWRNEFEAMEDRELLTLIASNNLKNVRLRLAQTVAQERQQALQQEHEREALRLADDANSLAETANEKAATANTIATVAIVMAAIAVGVSIVGLFIG